MNPLIGLAFLATVLSLHSVAGAAQAAPIGPSPAVFTFDHNNPLVQQVHRRPWSHCHSTYGYPYCHGNYLGHLPHHGRQWAPRA